MLKEFKWEDAVQGKIVGFSGDEYVMESELSAERYYKLQQYILEMYTGRDAPDIIAKIARAYQALNDGKGPRLADASVELNDLMNGLQSWGYQSKKAIMCVSLFMNRKSDAYDKRVRFDEADLMLKVADLEAVYGIQGFSNALTNITAGLKKS